ncbi:hypothetical protein GCM10022212_24510 [Actimicrobium antarcticum]|uniref:Type III effector protein n=2 Tax=Actimicrobium antarcticum TaxID=1051899 RepID=A0ABP7TGF7_9BURK
MRTRIARLFNTKKVPDLPALKFPAEWATAAGDICQRWIDEQTRHDPGKVSLVALSRMKALDYERRNLPQIHAAQRLLPASATQQDYYQAQIEAFLAAVGEEDPQPMLESFKHAGTGGLHRQHATVGATVSNSLSAAILLAPDPVTRVALVAARLLTQSATSAAVIAAGPRRFRNACAEDVMQLGRADAAPAAKRAPNMLQASLAVMRILKGSEKNLQEMQSAMQALERAQQATTPNPNALRETRQRLELAFARICHQLSVKFNYKAASESAKIEFFGNLRYLLTSYTGFSATLTAGLLAIMTPVFIGAAVTGGLVAGAAALTVAMYLGYQLSTGPSRDGEEKAKRAIVALVKMLEVLSGEDSAGMLSRAKAYSDYLQERKVPRFCKRPARQRIRQAAKTRLLERLAETTRAAPAHAGLDPSANWQAYRSHLDSANAMTANAAQDPTTGPASEQQLAALNAQFSARHQNDFAVKTVVDAWKLPMSIRLNAASRILQGKVARSHKRLLALKPGVFAGTGHGRSGQTIESKRAIDQQKNLMRDHLFDMFNLELALQDLKLSANPDVDSPRRANATGRLAAITDQDVRRLFCGTAEEQVESIRLSKELTAGESERYTHANAGSAFIGIVLNIVVPAVDLGISADKAAGTYGGPKFNDYKFVFVSQAGAQPGAHQSAGDRAAMQGREIQPQLQQTELAEPAPEFDLDIALAGHAMTPADGAAKNAMDGLMQQLCNADVVPRTLRLALTGNALATGDVSGEPVPPSQNVAVNLKPTTAFHSVQYKKNPFVQRFRHISGQLGIIGRQASMSIFGLPAQLLAQRNLNSSRPTLNNAARLTGRVLKLLQLGLPATPAPACFPAEIVPPNTSGLLCLDNEHVIRVPGDAPDQPPRPIHAHRADQQLRTGASYAAGQSPEDARVEDFLLQGIASGQGIFQFVSRRAHHAPERSRETPVIALLEQRCLRPDKPLIGGRYRLESVERTAGKNADDGSDFLRAEVLVIDTWSTALPAAPLRIPITQAGLKFTDRLLRVEQIERASALLDAHNDQCLTPDTPEAADKMVLSFAGIGRNATLITYRVLRDAIARGELTQDTLDAALDAEITANRARRGPGYVHSIEQRNELREALSMLITRRDS